MSFYGSYFSFNSIPCFEYGLMLYDVESTNEGGKFSSAIDISEDRTVFRYKPLYYGSSQNKPLTFSVIFGADMNLVDLEKHLDRWDMDAIATWLTGHDGYKYLEITQPDMEAMRYKCMISNLEYISYGNMPWAFRCDIRCDSPFAYLYPEKASFDVNGSLKIVFYSRASVKYFLPKIKISIVTGTDFSIKNHTDNGKITKFEKLPSVPIEIYIDNENEVITNSKGLNIYDCFNFNFLKLLRGNNTLEFTGNGQVEFECEFPINIGG